MNPTRKELGYYQRNQLQIMLANGMTVTAPALDVLGALLTVLTPEQKTKLFEVVVRSAGKPIMTGPTLTVPTLPRGYTNGIHTT